MKASLLAPLGLIIAGAILASGITPSALSITPFSSGTGVIVPLYTYPTSPTWSQVVQAKQSYPSVPFLAIVNPNSGVGSLIDQNYVQGVKNLQGAGVIVLGYVYTSYGQRSLSSVESEMLLYRSWYGVNGIFLDEAPSSPGSESYYSSLGSYAASIGLSNTVENEGATPSASYVGTANLLVVYEGAGVPNLSALPSYGKGNLAVLAYGVPTLDANWVDQAKSYAAYLYVTDDILPNPWDSLPSYFTQEVAVLAAPASTMTATTQVVASTTTQTTTTFTTTTVVQPGVTSTVTSTQTLAAQGSSSPSDTQYVGYGLMAVGGLTLVVRRKEPEP